MSQSIVISTTFEPIYRKYYDRNFNSIAIYKQISSDGAEILFWNDKRRTWSSESNFSNIGSLKVTILNGKTLDDIKVEIL